MFLFRIKETIKQGMPDRVLQLPFTGCLQVMKVNGIRFGRLKMLYSAFGCT